MPDTFRIHAKKKGPQNSIEKLKEQPFDWETGFVFLHVVKNFGTFFAKAY